MSQLTAVSYWQFACHIYDLKGVQSLLLELQNKQQKNVNLCLLLLFLDKLKLQLTQAQFEKLRAAAEISDDQLLRPIRSTRHNLKRQFMHTTQYADIRKKLLDGELALEKLQQTILLEALPQSIAVSTHTSNLIYYLDTQSQNQLLRCL